MEHKFKSGDFTWKDELWHRSCNHKALEHEIAEAMAHGSTHQLKVAELKRRQLLLKDEIDRLRSTVYYESEWSRLENGSSRKGSIWLGVGRGIANRRQASPSRGYVMRIAMYWITFVLFACSSEAIFAADAKNGSRLVDRWCVSCHIVSSAQEKGMDATPSFASIAQRADFSAEKLALFLLEPHPKMPNMSLSRDEARDIAAYISTQRR